MGNRGVSSRAGRGINGYFAANKGTLHFWRNFGDLLRLPGAAFERTPPHCPTFRLTPGRGREL